MKRKYALIVLSLLLVLSLCVVAACNPNETPTTTDIASITQSGTNNSDVTFVGKVVGTVNGGFFIGDDKGIVKVESTSAVTAGSVYKVSGKLSVSKNLAVVKDATAEASNQSVTLLSPADSSISAVMGLVAGRANYYKYVKLAGIVAKDGSTYTLSEGDSFVIIVGNTAAFDSRVGQKAEAAFVLSGYSDSWEATYLGDASGVSDYAVDLSSVSGDIFDSVELPAQVYLSLALPTSYPAEPGVTYTWSVKSGTAISVAQNVATVNDVAADETVKLTLTLSAAGGQTDAHDYDVTVKAAPAKTFAEAASSGDGAIIKVTGQVIAKGYNASPSRYTLMLTDSDHNILALDVTAVELDKYAIGDTVKAVGSFVNEDAPHVGAVEVLLTSAAPVGFKVDWEAYNPTTLATDEDYALLDGSASQMNKVYKLVKPYVVYSGNTTYNYIRLGASADKAANGSAKNGYVVFYKVSFEENAPLTNEQMQIPFLSSGAKQYEAYTFYAISHSGSGLFYLIVADDNAVTVDYSAMIADEIDSYFAPDKVVYAKTADALDLPSTTPTAGDITWTASPADAIDVTTGQYGAVTEEKTVTLTAHYTIAGQAYTYDVVLTFKPEEMPNLTISQLVAGNAGYVPMITAYLGAFGTTSGNTAEQRAGLILTDGVNSVWYRDAVYEAGNAELKIGDQIVLKGAIFSKENNGYTLSGGRISVASSSNTIDYSNISTFAEVSSEETLAQLALSMTSAYPGVTVKFSGLYWLIGTGSNNTRFQIHYKGDKVDGSAGARYEMGDGHDRTFSFSVNGNAPLLGADWAKNLGCVQGSKVSYPVAGEIWAVSCGAGDTMYAFSIVKANFHAATDEELAAYEVANCLPAEIIAGEAGTYTLPTSTAHATDLTFTVADSQDVTVSEGKINYKAVSEATPVTFNVSYKVGGVQKSGTVKVSFVPEPVVLNLAEALAQQGKIDELKDLVVVGIAPGHTGSATAGTGLYVSDGTNVACVTTAAGTLAAAGESGNWYYTLGGTKLAYGDKITLKSVTVDGKTIVCDDFTTGTIATDKVDISGDWFKGVPTKTISNDTELAAYMASLSTGSHDATYSLIKVTATADNPLYAISARGGDKGSTQKYFVALRYLTTDEQKNATTSADLKYTMSGEAAGYFGAHTATLIALKGEEWVIANTIMGTLGAYADWKAPATPSSSTQATAYPLQGEFYCFLEYSGSATFTFVYMGILACGLTLAPVVAA